MRFHWSGSLVWLGGGGVLFFSFRLFLFEVMGIVPQKIPFEF